MQNTGWFVKAILLEFNGHFKKKHWTLIHKEDVPKGEIVLESVWAIKRKRDINTRSVYKWKARINVHGGHQEYGRNYMKKYSPKVTWLSAITKLFISVIKQWHTRQVDFVLTHTQAHI